MRRKNRKRKDSNRVGKHTVTNLLTCFELETLDDDVDYSCGSSDEDVSDDDEDDIIESGGMAVKI